MNSVMLKDLVLAWFLFFLPTAVAAPVGDDKLKAAFVLNFAKFMHWPEMDETPDVTENFLICLLGYTSLTEALQNFTGKSVYQRALTFRYVELPGDVRECRIVFFAASEPGRLRRDLAALAEWPVLTVSDLPDFIAEGGMIGLVHQDKHLRFEINLDTVHASGLQVEAKLIKLAARVYSSHEPND